MDPTAGDQLLWTDKAGDVVVLTVTKVTKRTITCRATEGWTVRFSDKDRALASGRFTLLEPKSAEKTAQILRAYEALRAAVTVYNEQYGLEHESECPEDDTCGCMLVQNIEKALHPEKFA